MSLETMMGVKIPEDQHTPIYTLTEAEKKKFDEIIALERGGDFLLKELALVKLVQTDENAAEKYKQYRSSQGVISSSPLSDNRSLDSSPPSSSSPPASPITPMKKLIKNKTTSDDNKDLPPNRNNKCIIA